MLCEHCQEREARVGLTRIRNGETTREELCEECCQALKGKFPSGFELPLGFLPSVMADARCYYCGAAAVTGHENKPWEMELRKEPYCYFCHRCIQLYAQCMREAVSALREGLSHGEQVLGVEELIRDVDARMRAALSNAG
jgi:protein-arginine kinase activator protein McsA